MIPAKTVAIHQWLAAGALYGRTMSGSTIRSLRADADVMNQPTQNPTPPAEVIGSIIPIPMKGPIKQTKC